LLGVGPRNGALLGPATETVAGVPIAACDVLGQPLVHRVAEQLLRSGVSAVTILADSRANVPATARQNLPRGVTFALGESPDVWRDAERVFEELTDAGAELVLVWRLGAYAELELEPLVQAHLDLAGRTTHVCDASGEPLDIVLVCGSRRNDAAYLFRHQLQGTRMPGCTYQFNGYVNRLRSASELRQLTVDGMLLRNAVKPLGREVKPGVWLANGARIQKGARLVAPCYVGAYARVRSAAVITRGSAVEHHAEVDCGTVVEAANILPLSYVGAGLDVCHAVVGYCRMAPLRRPVEVEITDPRLVSVANEHAPLRAATTAGALLSFLPLQVLRGLIARKPRPHPPDLPSALKTPSAALREAPVRDGSSSPEFPVNMMVARRYGNE
jgi:carbonic anhydrase/acetyltransferase-like protein (isoleucine patch superfamily)